MLYIVFLLELVLFIVLGLYSTANGAGPTGLAPVQTALKPAANPLSGAVGPLGIIAVIWGFFGLIQFILLIELLGYDAPRQLVHLLGILVLIVVGTLAGYPSVAAFFGAPASGAGKIFDWIKRTFGGAESIFGLIALVLGLWTLIDFILERSHVY